MIKREIYEVLKFCDMYGFQFNLKYKNKNIYSSIFSITLTFVTFITVFILGLIFFIELFNHKEFNIVVNEVNIPNKASIIDFSTVPLMIGFLNGFIPKEINSKYIYIIFQRNEHYIRQNENGKDYVERFSYKIELENCNASHLYGNDKYFQTIDYSKFLCPKIGQNLTFSGRYGDKIYGYDILEIHLVKCSNNTDDDNDNNNNNNVECKSDEEIDEYIEDGYLTIYYLQYTLDHFNISNPIIKSVRSEIFMVANNQVKRYYYYLNPSKYYSDKGIIFKDIQNYNFYEYHNTQNDFIDREKQVFFSQSTLIELNFSCVNIRKEYSRIYKKITDVFGYLSGVISFMACVFQVLSDFLNEKNFIINYSNLMVKENINKNNFFGNFNEKNINFNSSSNNKITNHSNLDSNYYKKKKTKSNLLKKNLNHHLNKDFISNKSSKNNNISNSNRNFIFNKNKNINKQNYNNEFKILDNKGKINFIKYKNKIFYFPFWFSKNKKKYNLFHYCKFYIYKYLNLETFIPLLEKISKKEININYIDLNSTDIDVKNEKILLKKYKKHHKNSINNNNKIIHEKKTYKNNL